MASFIKPILDYAIKSEASDIHLTEGDYVWFRINWTLSKIEKAGKLDSTKTKEVILELLWGNKPDFDEYIKNKDADFAYIHEDGTPFRVNTFFKLWKMWVVMRRIAWEPKTIEELGLPEAVKKFTKAKQGLILVTGPTGSGKSTSMVSVLNEINENRNEHVLTVEDPVEFVFKDKKSVFSQRELWRDTKTFQSALRAAMREDPDIIVVWEMRDRETVEAAMELAETGHLVISTMHTSWSVQTITRLVNFFPPDIQNSVRYKLADILFGVLSQRLIKTADRKGRTGIFELMLMTSWIKNLIRTWEFNQINNNIEMWRQQWMIRMKAYADEKAKSWLIKEEDYIDYFEEDY